MRRTIPGCSKPGVMLATVTTSDIRPPNSACSAIGSSGKSPPMCFGRLSCVLRRHRAPLPCRGTWSRSGTGGSTTSTARAPRRSGPLSPYSVFPHESGRYPYLSNGGTLEHAQQIAGHASPKTTKLYDRTADTVTVDEIERIVI